MSVYITMNGSLQFPNTEALEKAVKLLTDGGWMKDRFMVDENGDKYGHEEDDLPDVNGLFLDLPFGLYRNFPIEHLSPGTKGRVVWTCTDGEFQGCVISDGVETLYDLEKWGKEQKIEYEPEDGEDEPAIQCEWQRLVEFAFMETFGD